MLIFKSTTWRELERTRPRGTSMISFVGVYTAPFVLLLFPYDTCQSFRENTTKSCPKTSSIQYASMSLVCIIFLAFESVVSDYQQVVYLPLNHGPLGLGVAQPLAFFEPTRTEHLQKAFSGAWIWWFQRLVSIAIVIISETIVTSRLCS